MSSAHVQGSKLQYLQALRAVAVLFVLFAHSSSQLGGGEKYRIQSTGHFGVDIFFVISGFIMVYISSRRNLDGLSFLRERVVRIVPVYWFYNLLAVAVFIAMPQAFRDTVAEPMHVLLSMFFIPHENPSTGSYSPFVRLGWTLNYEMFFYVVFAIMIAISFRRRVLLTTVALVLAAALGLLAEARGVMLPGILAYYMNDKVLEFIFGMLIAVLYLRGQLPLLPKWTALVVILVALAVVFLTSDLEVSSSLRGLVWGPPAALILIAARSFEDVANRPRWRWLCLIGDASFTLYLLHLFPLTAYRLVWLHLGLPSEGLLPQGLFVLSAISVICVIGYIAYLVIEQPLVRGAKMLLGPHPVPVRRS